MKQLYLLFISIGFVFSLSAQSHDLPCDAFNNPEDGWGTTTETQTLSGDFTGVSPWVTDVAGGDIQDFGVMDADSSLFYKLEVDPNTRYLRLEYMMGTAIDISIGLFSVVSPECPSGSGTNYGEALYQDPDMDDMLVEDFIGEGEVMFDLCGFLPPDYDNLYLWLAVPDGSVGDFDIEVTQMVSPYNNVCDDASDPARQAGDLGTLAFNAETGEGLGCTAPGGWTADQTNEAACPVEFDFNVTPCFDGHEDEPSVWYTFQTGPDVELIDLTVEHLESFDLRVSVFEMENPCLAGNVLFPPSQDQDDYCQSGSDLIEFEDLTVKPNTTYYIVVSTPIDEWGELDICLEVCEPPANNEVCDATDVDFPDLGSYDPDDPVETLTGETTECAYGFFQDVDLGTMEDFGCGDDVEHAVFYKLNVDDYATKLTITSGGLSTGGALSAQVFIMNTPPDCATKTFDYSIPTNPDFNECDLGAGADLEIDLCEIDNAEYDNLYLWIASTKEDAGEFDLEFFQEIAPENDLCADATSPDREARDLGVLAYNDATGEGLGCTEPAGWNGPQTNRGACPVEFDFNVTPCFDGHEDDPTVWYTFETGPDVEEIDLTVEHFESSDLRVSVFEMENPCMAGNALFPPSQDNDDYCDSGSDLIEFEDLTVKPSTQYFIVVSTPIEEWGEFDICLEVCEPPANNTICDAEEIDFPSLGDYDPDDPIGPATNGTTVCAYGFYDDADLGSLIDFDCGDEFENAVFYKLNLDYYATELTITVDGLSTGGQLAAQVFFFDGTPDCVARGFNANITVPASDEFEECDFAGGVEWEMDLCEIDNEDYENMYLWIATNKEDAGEFNLEFFQEVAPVNDECNQMDGPEAGDREAADLGVIEVGDASGDCDPPSGWDTQTNRGACPVGVSGNGCFDEFQNEPAVWYTFETGEGVELITVDVNHFEADEVRIGLFELPVECEFPGNMPPGQPFDEYCQGDVFNDGVDSIWNILVQQNTRYYVLVSTDIEEWGEFEICVKNCEPPENDRLCDVSMDEDYHVVPGEEDEVNRNPVIVGGTTVCANNFFTDFELTTEDFGCNAGDGAESAVFYKIDLDSLASEVTIIANEIDPLNTFSMGLFMVMDSCEENRQYQQQIWVDPEGEEMVSCDGFDQEIVFNTCGLSMEERNNIYLWVGTERLDQGEFELEISQKVAPENDDCAFPHSETFERTLTDTTPICGTFTNLFACPEEYTMVTTPPGADPMCPLDPLEIERAGVWFEFSTNSDAARLDYIIDHSNQEEVQIMFFEANTDCDDFTQLICENENDPDGYIEEEDLFIEPDMTYYVLVVTEKENAGEFELCITVKPPIPCEGEAPYFYDQTEIICGLDALDGYCLDMRPPYGPAALPWPGCPSVSFHNPSWFTFVAGAEDLEIEVFISDCIQNQGVQIALYELDCEIDFDPTNPDGTQPTADMLVSPCSFVTAPTQGSVIFNTTTESGQVYGIIVDGWNGDQCNVSVEEVLVGGDPPELDGTDLEEPSFVDGEFGFLEDTICAGAEDVPFTLEGEVEGACSYRWTLDGEDIEDGTNSTEEFIDFPEPGTYEICVYASNLCNETDPVCIEVVVAPLEPFITFDTICEGDDYVWIGPFGDELTPEPAINPNNPGTFQYESTAFNQFDCTVPAELNLFIRNENDENPTQIDTFGCYDDVALGDFSYYCEVLTEPGTYDQECISPFTGCDTFFTIDLVVFGGPFTIDPACTGNREMGFFFQDPEEAGYTPWFEQFLLIDNDPDLDIEYNWIVINEEDTLGNERDLILNQDTIEKYADNRFLNLRLEVTITNQGDVICTSSAEYYFDLDNNFPRAIDILGDTSYCAGQPELTLFANVESPIFPDPNGEPDPIFLLNWDLPDGFEFVPPDTIDSDTITISAPNTVTDSTICVTVFSERCFFTDTLCIDLSQEIPDVPELGPDGFTCDTFYTFSPDLATSGGWSVIDTPPTGNTLIFGSVGSPTTTISVSDPGTYTLEWREGPVSCAEYDTIQVTFWENPFEVNYADTCFDLDFQVEIEIGGGEGPYTVHPNTDISGSLDSNIFTSDIIEIDFQGNYGDILYLVVEDANGCISDSIPITLVCECESEVGTMATDTLELCEGDEAFATYLGGHENDGNDTSMYILHDMDNDTLGAIIDTATFIDGGIPYPDGITFGQVYYISTVIGNAQAADSAYVNLIDPCLVVAPGQPVIWYENPIADAGMDREECGFDTNLAAMPSVGTGTWTAVPDTGAVVFDDPNDPNTLVTVDEIGVYTFRWTENNEGCEDFDEVDIDFKGDILFTWFDECNDVATEYRVTIILTGGGGDYFEVNGEGTMVGDTLFSDWIPRGTAVTFTVDDALGCGPIDIPIFSDCECTTDIGVLDTANFLTACADECIDITSYYADSGEFLDGNDVASYILHNSNDTIPGSVVIGQRANGIFCYEDFSSAIEYGDTLYAARIVGNNRGTGEVDINDPCLKLTYGIPILFYEVPDADAGPDEQFCFFEGQLEATFATDGTGEWTYHDGPSANVDIIDPTSDTTSVVVEDYGLHQFVWTETNEGCVDSDTVSLTFVSTPEFDPGSVQIDCDDIAENYTVTIDILLGDDSTLVVDGTVDGTLTGRTFVSDPIPSGDTYTFRVYDVNGCDTLSFSDSFECPCLTEIGAIEGDELHLCEDESAFGIRYNSDGDFQDGNDELRYVLVNDQGDRLIERTNGSFSFDDAIMNLGETYYVRVYLGSVIGGDFQYDEDCTLWDGEVPVTWWAYPEANAVAAMDTITCVIESIEIDGSSSIGQRLEFAWSTTDGSIEAGTADQAVVSVTAGGTYTLVVTDALSGCSDEVSVVIEQSDDVPEAIIQTPEILTCLVDEVTLDGSASSSGPDIVYSWTTTDGNIVSDPSESSITADEIGTYELVVEDQSNNCRVSAQVTVTEDRDIPDVEATALEQLSCSSEEVTVSGEGSSEGANFTYSWSTTDDGEIVGGTTGRDIQVSSIGTYTLVVTNEDNGCVDSTTAEVVRADNELAGIEVDFRHPQCHGDVNGLIEIEPIGGEDPITYTLVGIEENTTGTFSNLGPGDYTIEVTDTYGCVETAEVTLIDPPIISLTLTESVVIESGDSVIVDAFLPADAIIDTLIWDTEGQPYRCLDEDCLSIMITPLETVTVSAEAIGGVGCSDADAMRIIVKVYRDVYIPNVFTPNGDGMNDFFLPETGRRVTQVNSMQIFDRWGSLLFESRNFMTGDTNFGWDGTFRGEEMNPGSYVYKVEVTYDNGTTELLHGSVTLVR
jgi:gliding motility-associated-like protein